LLLHELSSGEIHFKEAGEMKSTAKTINQKGETSANFILLGVLIILAAVFAISYFQNRNDVITIHLPRIETR
jgi:hypothetical protein